MLKRTFARNNSREILRFLFLAKFPLQSEKLSYANMCLCLLLSSLIQNPNYPHNLMAALPHPNAFKCFLKKGTSPTKVSPG